METTRASWTNAGEHGCTKAQACSMLAMRNSEPLALWTWKFIKDYWKSAHSCRALYLCGVQCRQEQAAIGSFIWPHPAYDAYHINHDLKARTICFAVARFTCRPASKMPVAFWQSARLWPPAFCRTCQDPGSLPSHASQLLTMF